MKSLVYKICIILLLIPSIVLAEEIDLDENITNEVTQEENQEGSVEEEKVSSIIVTLEKCIDGDTAKFKSEDGSIITYRFLAINAPELANLENEEEPYALEASKYTCDKLTTADEIKLEFDENANEKDAYDRGLAWVFVDKSLLQEELIENGYAKVGYLYGDYKYNTLLQEKEEVAKNAKVGIWNEDEVKQEQEENETKEEDNPKEKEKTGNFLIDFLNGIIENLLASFNNFVDSILQKLEDML